MSFLRKSVAALVAVAGMAVAGSANADTVTATFNGVTPGLSVAVNYDGALGGSAFNQVTSAGRFNWTTTGTNPAPPLTVGSQVFNVGTQFITFCIELNQSIASGGSATFTVSALTSAPGVGPTITGATATSIRELWEDHYYQHVINNSNSAGLAQNAAAFQVAIWELIYDQGGAKNVAAGHITFTSSPAVVQAQSWLAALDGTVTVNTNVIALTSQSSQDQSFIISSAPIVETPLPPVMWGGIGLLGMSLVGKLRGGRRNA